MKAKPLNPRRLDLESFISTQAALEGAVSVAELPRLSASVTPQTFAQEGVGMVHWSAQGRSVAQRYAQPELWLDLHARVDVILPCQRCLLGVLEHVEFERSLRFVKDEAQAAELDAQLDDDVLAVSRAYDLVELIEDELIMALPIVPRHESCPDPHPALLGEHGDDDLGDDVLADEDAPMQAAAKAPGAGQPQVEAAQGEGSVQGKPHPFAILSSLKKPPKTP